MPVSFRDVLKSTGAEGQRKGLEPYANKVVTLTEFKVEEKGRGIGRGGQPKEKRRILTAKVSTEGQKPRRARIPVRYAQRLMQDMDMRDDPENYEVVDVLVQVGEHGATLRDPNDFPRSKGGWADDAPNANGTTEKRRPGRPRRAEQEPAPATA